MKRLSWPGVIVVAASTILSWLNTSPAVQRVTVTREAIESRPLAQSMAPTAAAIAAMRLHNWRPPVASAREKTDRNLFAFKRSLVRPPAAPRRGLSSAGDAVQPSLVLFELIGLAEDTGPDGAVRTAIISGQGQLYLVKKGEAVGENYRVGEILSDRAELVDNRGGPNLRLALK